MLFQAKYLHRIVIRAEGKKRQCHVLGRLAKYIY